jgi:hypothetical protein
VFWVVHVVLLQDVLLPFVYGRRGGWILSWQVERCVFEYLAWGVDVPYRFTALFCFLRGAGEEVGLCGGEGGESFVFCAVRSWLDERVTGRWEKR